MNLLILTLSSLFLAVPLGASVQTAEDIKEPAAIVSFDDSPSTCILTQLDVEITSSFANKTVTTTLYNSFTLFPSTVKVTLRLYSSLTETTNVAEMELEGQASSSDLNMGESISVTVSNHNEGRYWVGYAIYYKSGGNSIYQTDPLFVTAAGL